MKLLFSLFLIFLFISCSDPVSVECHKPEEKIEQIKVIASFDFNTMQDSTNLFLSTLDPIDIVETIYNVRNVYYQGDLHPQHSVITRYTVKK